MKKGCYSTQYIDICIRNDHNLEPQLQKQDQQVFCGMTLPVSNTAHLSKFQESPLAIL